MARQYWLFEQTFVSTFDVTNDILAPASTADLSIRHTTMAKVHEEATTQFVGSCFTKTTIRLQFREHGIIPY